jgi:hypothetical protein
MELDTELDGLTDALGESEALGERDNEEEALGDTEADTEALGDAEAEALEPAGAAVKVAPGVKGFHIAVKLITPSVITPVPTVKIISSSVTSVGKFATVSAVRAAGDAIHDLWISIEVAVVVVTKPVVRVTVPRARVPFTLRGVLRLCG